MVTSTAASSGGSRLYVTLISLVAAMGGLLFGYDWVVIGGAKPFYEAFFRITDPSTQGWAMSCALVGCLLGALVSGVLADRFGRKRLLILSAALFGLSSVATGSAPSFHLFIFWRIAGGVAIGLASNLSPLYISEISPAHLRGRLVAMNQLTIVIGILLAQIVNWLIADAIPMGATADFVRESWNGQTGWRFMFAAVAVPAALFFASAFFVPESPRWLVKQGQEEPARRTLARIAGPAHAEAEMGEIRATLSAEARQHGRLRDLADRRLTRVLAIGVGLAVFQQWCGINVIFNYAQEVFQNAGFDMSSMLLQIVLTGVVNLVFAIVALQTVDRAGRRVLMLLGSAGLAVTLALVGLGYHFQWSPHLVMVFVLAAIGCYSFSLAPVVWVLISEIFPNRIRGAAMSVAVVALWIACFLLTYTFPVLNRWLGPARTFWLYAAVCVVGFVFVYCAVPETKGRSLEELERELRS